MRKITEQSVKAFMSGRDFKSGNTEVSAAAENADLLLFGNLIAKKRGDNVFISDAGWQSNSTKERLNGVCDMVGTTGINQVKGVWYRGNDVVVPQKWIQVK